MQGLLRSYHADIGRAWVCVLYIMLVCLYIILSLD